MSVFCLGSDEIDQHWDKISPHLYRLQRRGVIDAEEVRSDCKADQKQLWGYEEDGEILGLAITRITKGRVCEFYGAVGTQSAAGQIQMVHDEVVKWAKSINCTKLRFHGRKGWLRLLDYTQVGVIGEKEL